MNKKTEIPGQAGAVGDNAHVEGNTFKQIEKAEIAKAQMQIPGNDNVAASNISNSNVSIENRNFFIGKVEIKPPDEIIIPALHQIEPPPRDFIGRKKEIKILLKALETGGVTISGLHGMGGVGKTALALKLAEHLKPSYPDAQFYLDLKGASAQPLSAAQAMAHVIRAYHPEAALPEDESRLKTIYLSLLEGKKAILLMDNAASREQIEPLIPPATCVLLVTSRIHFTLNGLFSKNLDTLEPKDAQQLLLKIAPRIGNCAEKIARLCGYLPLALEVTASALHKFVNIPPEEYVKRLTQETKRLKLVEASLSLSYELLSKELQTLWCMLSVFPISFDTAAVTELWKLPVEDTEDHLAELISHSLIEWNATTQRYRLHDLVRLFANSRLDEQQCLTAKKAHAFYFLNLLSQTCALYEKGSEHLMRGLALFDLERINIEAGQKWAASMIDNDETATRLSMRYYNYGVYVLSLRLHPRERIGWLETALKAARQLEDKDNESATLCNLGNAYWHLGAYRKAIEFYEQYLEIAREIGDRLEKGKVLGNLGIAYDFFGEPRKAIEFYEQNLEIARETGNRLSEGSSLGNLGIAYAALGDFHKAIDFCEQALLIDCEIGDRKGEGSHLGNLGNAYWNSGERHKAFEFHEQHLEIAREIGDRLGEGNALWNIALIYNDLEDQVQAISFAEMALTILEQVEAPNTSRDRLILEGWKAEQA